VSEGRDPSYKSPFRPKALHVDNFHPQILRRISKKNICTFIIGIINNNLQLYITFFNAIWGQEPILRLWFTTPRVP
jgi:hypothetical protein